MHVAFCEGASNMHWSRNTLWQPEAASNCWTSFVIQIEGKGACPLVLGVLQGD